MIFLVVRIGILFRGLGDLKGGNISGYKELLEVVYFNRFILGNGFLF